MPNRIIKDTICESKGLSEVSFFAEDLYKRLITYADDYGRFNADFQIVLARLYPREINLVSVDDIEDAMTELVGVGKIAFYTSRGRNDLYGCFPNWNDHQRMRDSKKKIPEPDNESINDWYLRRFVPITMKVEIIERDNFTCQECKKAICAGVSSAKRLVKMGAGLFHIDHIVPVNQGGRATLENLRLLCPDCNRRRQRHFSFDEILAFTQELHTNGGKEDKLAATRRNSPPNPIQSESNPNPESESNSNPVSVCNARARARETLQQQPPDPDRWEEFWNAYPRKSGGDIRQACMEYIAVIDHGVDPETLITAAKALAKRTAPDAFRYLPSAEKWLRNKGWLENPEAAQGTRTNNIFLKMYEDEYGGDSQ